MSNIPEADRIEREKEATKPLLTFVGEILGELAESGIISATFDLNGIIKSLSVTSPNAYLCYTPQKPPKPNS